MITDLINALIAYSSFYKVLAESCGDCSAKLQCCAKFYFILLFFCGKVWSDHRQRESWSHWKCVSVFCFTQCYSSETFKKHCPFKFFHFAGLVIKYSWCVRGISGQNTKLHFYLFFFAFKHQVKLDNKCHIDHLSICSCWCLYKVQQQTHFAGNVITGLILWLWLFWMGEKLKENLNKRMENHNECSAMEFVRIVKFTQTIESTPYAKTHILYTHLYTQLHFHTFVLRWLTFFQLLFLLTDSLSYIFHINYIFFCFEPLVYPGKFLKLFVVCLTAVILIIWTNSNSFYCGRLLGRVPPRKFYFPSFPASIVGLHRHGRWCFKVASIHLPSFQGFLFNMI